MNARSVLVWIATFLASTLSSLAGAQDDLVLSQTKLDVPGLHWSDWFSFAIGLDGDTAMVGAILDDDMAYDAGVVYVFERNAGGPGNWDLVQKLYGSDSGYRDNFGAAIAIDGDTALIADCFGEVYVFRRDANLGGWREVGKFSGKTLTFGRALALEGDTAVVGELEAEGGGAAFVYRRAHGGGWTRAATLRGDEAQLGSLFGHSVALTRDRIVVGAPGESHSQAARAGAAYVFEREGGSHDSWQQSARLAHAAPSVGASFGTSVALTNETIVVGAALQRASERYQYGTAHVFRSDGTAWREAATLVPPRYSYQFGAATAVQNGRVLVGSSTPSYPRSVFVYDAANDWNVQGALQPSDRHRSTRFGRSLAVSGNTVVVGGWQSWPVGYAEVFELKPAVLEVEIALRCNRPHRGLFRAAILTSDTFDAQLVDESSVRLGSERAEPRSSRLVDADRDGDLDVELVFHWKDVQLPQDATEVELLGTTADGSPVHGVAPTGDACSPARLGR